jgi:hypothetical protein
LGELEMEEYKNIYIENKLREIRTKLEKKKLDLSNTDKLNKTNEIMRKVLGDIYDFDTKKRDLISVLNLVNRKKIIDEDDDFYDDDIDLTLNLYYFAIYNDNTQLLKELLEKNYNFIGDFGSVNYFVLDKRITSNFDKDKYFELLRKYNEIFDIFYSSTLGDKNCLGVINSFCNIMNKKPEVVIPENEKDDIYSHLLTCGTLKVIGEDYILNSSDSEREIINALSKSFPKFYKSPCIGLTPYFSYDMLDYMSDEEIIDYNIESFKILLERLNEIKNINPDFDCRFRSGFINIHVFEAFTNEEIASMSNATVSDITSYYYTNSNSSMTQDEFASHTRSIYNKNKVKEKVYKFFFNK